MAETNEWRCSYCLSTGFTDPQELWKHFDQNECPGRPIGVLCRLENGVTGFISLNNLSDHPVEKPEDRVRPGLVLKARICKLNPRNLNRFSVNLSTKSSVLRNKELEQAFQDQYYDRPAEQRQLDDEKARNQRQASKYMRRVIAHPQFHNVDYVGCCKLLANMDIGDCVIRPSSKGSDHLTVTWKVYNEIYSHIDVREEEKQNEFSLGARLFIGDDEFEDLDEIVARHVQPMASHVRDIIGHKYFLDGYSDSNRARLEEHLQAEKAKQPSRIPYYFTPSTQLLGKFLLSYQPRSRVRHEYLTARPDGIRFRSRLFPTINLLVKWFKDHFNQPAAAVAAAAAAANISSNNNF